MSRKSRHVSTTHLSRPNMWEDSLAQTCGKTLSPKHMHLSRPNICTSLAQTYAPLSPKHVHLSRPCGKTLSPKECTSLAQTCAPLSHVGRLPTCGKTLSPKHVPFAAHTLDCTDSSHMFGRERCTCLGERGKSLCNQEYVPQRA